MMEIEKKDSVTKLLGVMDKSPGFAGLGATVQTIVKLGDDSDGGTRQITATILRDAALTAKLLRIANSSGNARGGRNVSTIDQALMVLGINTVKSVALSLALLASIGRKPQSLQLHAEIVASYFCGSLASEVTRLYGPRFSTQEAHVCGLMQNLGRMMSVYYLYEDIERARVLQTEDNLTEDAAILQVLGVSFDQIGVAIARHWCLPDVLQASLAVESARTPPRTTTSSLAWQQVCACFSRRITDLLFRFPENREKIEINREIEFFRLALHLKDNEIRELIERCLIDTDGVLAEMAFPANVEQARKLLRKASERVLDMLSADDSLTQRRNSIDGKTPVEIIQQVLRRIHDHFGFDHTLICLPDSSSGLLAIAGVGQNASQVTARFRCYGAKIDLFRAIMARKIDIFVADIHLPAYAKLIPEWYSPLVGARSFVMLPLIHGDRLLGMIYGDFCQPRPVAPEGLAQGEMLEWRASLIQALLSGSPKPG